MIGLGTATTQLDTAVNIAFPAITRGFDLGISDIQWVVICYVLAYASLAHQAGLQGVVCSPHEAGAVHGLLGQDFLTVTPGVRFADGAVVQLLHGGNIGRHAAALRAELHDAIMLPRRLPMMKNLSFSPETNAAFFPTTPLSVCMD